MSRRSLALVVALVMAYAVLGHRYLSYWHSDRTLWRYAAAQTPQNPLPVVNNLIASLP